MSLKCNLSTIMGAKRLKISDVSEGTGINRGTITRLFHETYERVDKEVIEKLCVFLEVEVGDLFQLVKDDQEH